jgi:hypothetical protein
MWGDLSNKVSCSPWNEAVTINESRKSSREFASGPIVGEADKDTVEVPGKPSGRSLEF